jgi:hypothetical protein
MEYFSSNQRFAWKIAQRRFDGPAIDLRLRWSHGRGRFSLKSSRKARIWLFCFAFLMCFVWFAILSSIGLGEESSRQQEFQVQASRPYQLVDALEDPNSVPEGAVTLDARQIANLASWNSGPANLIAKDQPYRSDPKHRRNEQYEKAVCEVRSATAHRLRETSASVALKLHFGIAACVQANHLLQRTGVELDRQILARSKLEDEGIAVEDPFLLERLRNNWRDQVLENESKERVLRIQLSELIGPCACRYSPTFSAHLLASDIDVCEYLEIAARCRQEIAILQRLRSTIDESSIENWNDLAAFLTNTPVVRVSSLGWLRRLRRSIFRAELEQAVHNRKEWLDSLMEERAAHIQKEIEVAYEQKKTAAYRWSVAKDQLGIWEERLAQLVRIGEEIKGNLAEQSEARLMRLQSESSLIQRWLEWHQSSVELLLASGQLLQPGGLEGLYR